MMKKINSPELNSFEPLTQERINDLHEDILTILESHCEDVDLAMLFRHITSYLTEVFCEFAQSKEEVLKVLCLAIDEGISNHLKNTES